jgi:hypothetical protein
MGKEGKEGRGRAYGEASHRSEVGWFGGETLAFPGER